MQEDAIERLREAVRVAGMSPREVSLKAGFGTHFLQKLFSDKPDKPDPGASRIQAICDVIGTDLIYILTGIRTDFSDPLFERVTSLWQNRLSEESRKEVARFVEWRADQDKQDETGRCAKDEEAG